MGPLSRDGLHCICRRIDFWYDSYGSNILSFVRMFILANCFVSFALFSELQSNGVIMGYIKCLSLLDFLCVSPTLVDHSVCFVLTL